MIFAMILKKISASSGGPSQDLAKWIASLHKPIERVLRTHLQLEEPMGTIIGPTSAKVQGFFIFLSFSLKFVRC